MNRIISFFIIIAFATVCLNCKTYSHYDVEVTGSIQEQGMTTYQYGTHVLQGEVMYALKSDDIILNNYIGKTVTLKGVKVDGYPVDGGPEFLLVLEISE